jgi:hypothetical protein
MVGTIMSAVQATAVARHSSRYMLWIFEADASAFKEPGWTRVEPPQEGAVLFLHVVREISVARTRGIL